MRIRRSGQILRFAFHGSVDHGFVAGCEEFVFLGVRVSYWPFDRRSCVGNTTFRSACMATGIFVSTSFGQPIFMWSLPKRFHSPTWESAVSSTLFACQWTSNIVPVTVLPSSTYSTLTRAISNIFLSVRQDVHARMSGLSTRLNVPVQGLEDNIFRYTNSFVMVDAVLAQYKPLLLHGGVPMAFPAPTKSIRLH